MTLGDRAGALLLVAVVLAALAAGLAAPAGASAADTTPPAASASLPAYVTASGVTVTVVASDPESGIVDARLSNEGAAWSGWLVLPDPDPTSGETTARLAWDVGASTGDKTVYVEVRNGEGLTTQVTASTRLLLATDLTVHAVPPVVVFGTSGELRGVVANSSTVAGSVELSLDAKPETGGDFSLVTSFMSQGWALRTAVSPAVNTVYRVSYAGDGGLEAPASTEVLVRVRPRITTDFPRSFWLGKTVRLKGRVVPAHPDSQVTIERKSGGVWADFTTVTLDEASSFNVPFKPTRPGFKYFRIRMAADAEHALAITTSRRIVVNNPNPHGVPLAYPHYIVTDYSKFRFYYYEHGRLVRSWPCVLGKSSTPTPQGHFKIYARQADPGWFMGPYKLLYYGSIGIHGTSQPWLLDDFPRAYSHGCTRLTNAQITWLYQRVPVGTPVWNIR